MKTRPFHSDPAAGVTRLWHEDEATGLITIETQADVTDLVEQNKILQNSETERYGEFTRVASIPMSIYWELVEKGITDDPKAMKAWLNDRDNRVFRTKLGRV